MGTCLQGRELGKRGPRWESYVSSDQPGTELGYSNNEEWLKALEVVSLPISTRSCCRTAVRRHITWQTGGHLCPLQWVLNHHGIETLWINILDSFWSLALGTNLPRLTLRLRLIDFIAVPHILERSLKMYAYRKAVLFSKALCRKLRGVGRSSPIWHRRWICSNATWFVHPGCEGAQSQHSGTVRLC